MIAKHYDSLDGLRALACIGIIMMHVQCNITIKPSENFLTTNIISFCGNLVLLFMMVSAFSLCCGYFERFRNGNICIEDFFVSMEKNREKSYIPRPVIHSHTADMQAIIAIPTY